MFVVNDGDGKWAHYQITAAGTGTWSSASKTLVAAQDATLPISGGTLTGQLAIEQATPSKAFRVNSWAEVGGANGVALFGANIYPHWTGSAIEYRLANTHASLGYAAIRLTSGGLEFAAASGATTADSAVTPTWRTVYHSGNFTPADKANVAGDTFTGDISISKVAGNARALFFKSSTQNRWGIGATSAAESSGSAGSNFAINRYNDSGGLIGTALSITRSNGNTVARVIRSTLSYGALMGFEDGSLQWSSPHPFWVKRGDQQYWWSAYAEHWARHANHYAVQDGQAPLFAPSMVWTSQGVPELFADVDGWLERTPYAIIAPGGAPDRPMHSMRVDGDETYIVNGWVVGGGASTSWVTRGEPAPRALDWRGLNRS